VKQYLAGTGNNKNCLQHGVCCNGGAPNKTSAMCRHQQQFQRDEKAGQQILSSTTKYNRAAVLGWTYNEYRHSSKPCPL